MQNSQKLIGRLNEYVAFILRLRGVDEQTFIEPIREGKWSIRDTVAHIMMWDKNCIEKTLKRINRGGRAGLEEDADPQSFNERSVEYGRTLTQQEILDQSLYYRSELISQLNRLPAKTFEAQSKHINSMTLSVFIERLFVSHDEHHIMQMEAFLSKVGTRADSIET